MQNSDSNKTALEKLSASTFECPYCLKGICEIFEKECANPIIYYAGIYGYMCFEEKLWTGIIAYTAKMKGLKDKIAPLINKEMTAF